MKKTILLLTAIVLFLFSSYGFYQWLQSGDTLLTVWETLTRNWLLLITFVDAGVFTILCLFFLWRDASRRGLRPGRKIGWLSGTLLLGAPVFLLYLVDREKRS
jgi:hypothetical protein